MKPFVWDDNKFDVGIERFNIQHKQLLTALNDINKAMEDKRDKLALAQIINNLRKYVEEHLKEEEALLYQSGYPHYEAHVLQHKIFTKKLNQICEDFNADKQMLHFDIAIFLKNWIEKHIVGVDKKYTEFLNSKGIY